MTGVIKMPPRPPVQQPTITITLGANGELNVQSNMNDVLARIGALQAAIYVTLSQAQSTGRIVKP